MITLDCDSLLSYESWNTFRWPEALLDRMAGPFNKCKHHRKGEVWKWHKLSCSHGDPLTRNQLIKPIHFLCCGRVCKQNSVIARQTCDMQSNLKENNVTIKREVKASKRDSRSRHATHTHTHTLERTALRLLQLFLWRPLGGHWCTSNTQHKHIPLAMPLSLADTLQITVKWQETSSLMADGCQCVMVIYACSRSHWKRLLWLRLVLPASGSTSVRHSSKYLSRACRRSATLNSLSLSLWATAGSWSQRKTRMKLSYYC